ncbi:MAG TPA: shikimate kinase [bacterium]|nr:shikimate kinase [bacterium]
MKKTEKKALRPKLPDNIVLIGMFGSGKSTVGRILAQKLRYHFVDVDHLIEAKYKKPLQKVLDELGMKGFMKMEEAAIRALHYRHCVISPGGSAVYYPKGMAHLKKLGPRVFLKVPLTILKRRLSDWSNRGVVRRGGSTLPALYKERAPLFRKYADLTVPVKGKDAEKIALLVLRGILRS